MYAWLYLPLLSHASLYLDMLFYANLCFSMILYAYLCLLILTEPWKRHALSFFLELCFFSYSSAFSNGALLFFFLELVFFLAL